MEREVVRRHLAALWGAKEEGRGWILIWDARCEGARLVDHCSSGARTAAAAATAVERRQGVGAREVYVGVGLRENRPTRARRGGVKDVVGVTGLWCEFDIAGEGHADSRKKYPPDEATIERIWSATGLQPTVVVHSGHGLQAWWLFTDVWCFDSTEERDRFGDLAQRWQSVLARHAQEIGGWSVDSTADLARVLRVAGTENHKVPDNPVPVRLVKADGPRYTDWEPFEERAEAPGTRRVWGNVGGPVSFDEDAEPPVLKLEGLQKASRKFKQAWNRQRTDFNDQSGSAYCYSLAYHAIEAGWTDQEIVNLLICWRKKEAEPLKLNRPDWYLNDIAKARLSVEKNLGAERAIDLLTAPDRVDESTKEETIAAVSNLVGTRIVGFLQHGEEEAQYTFQLEDGKTIALGGGKQLFSVDTARERIYEKTGKILPDSLKRRTWYLIIQRLTEIREIIDQELGERKATLKEWVDDYIADIHAVYSDLGEEAWQPAVKERLPFVRYDQGLFYLHADQFRWWLERFRGQQVPRARLWDLLRHYGFKRRTVNGPPTKSYWCAPSLDFEEALKAHRDGRFLRSV